MIFFVAVLFLLIISGAEFSKPNEFNKDYISRAGTTAIICYFDYVQPRQRLY
mgnify:CR=1 FL=1